MAKKRHSLKRQAAVTAVSGALVRALGFFLRLWTGRLLGAEAVGIMELAASAHALAVTPGAAGVPGAVSRLTAQARTEEERQRVLRAGRQVAGGIGGLCSLLLLSLSPWIAGWLGDARTLPALLFYGLCPLLIALSSVEDGAFFGRGRALPPAISELGEQLVRLGAVAALAFLLPRLPPAFSAAWVAAGALLGEAAGLIIVRALSGRIAIPPFDAGALRKKIGALALPLILNRLTHTGLRSLSALVIPLRLEAGGLTHREAVSRLGMLNGMVLPLMFLPGLITGALAAVGGPAMARCRSGKAERRLAGRVLLGAAAAGCGGGALLYGLSPFLAQRLYGLPELTPLIRFACPLAAVTGVQQAASGLMTGLGLQKKTLLISLPGSLITLLFTWLWVPHQGMEGAIAASLLGHGLTLICCGITLFFRLTGDRQAKAETA